MRRRIVADGVRLGPKYLCQGRTAPLAHGNDNLTLVRLVLDQPPVNPIDGEVLRPDVAAEVGAIDFGCASVAADARPLCAGRHCLAQLMRQHKRSLILDIEVTAEGEHACLMTFLAVRGQRFTIDGLQPADGERGRIASMSVG